MSDTFEREKFKETVLSIRLKIRCNANERKCYTSYFSKNSRNIQA